MPRTRTPAPPARGYGVTRFNALRHGVLSRYTVLPWEDAEEYRRLLAALVEEHAPTGPTEEHLVEELAGVVWRKRRLRLAEAAANRRALEAATTPAAGFVSVMPTPDPAAAGVPEGLHATGEGEDPELAGLEADEAATRRALDRLAAGGRKAYGEALAELDEDTAGAWRERLSGDDGDPPAANAEALRRFLEDEVLPGTPGAGGSWPGARSSSREGSARRPRPRASSASAATRSTSTGSWSAPSRCCCASSSCAAGPTRADPFREIARGGTAADDRRGPRAGSPPLRPACRGRLPGAAPPGQGSAIGPRPPRRRLPVRYAPQPRGGARGRPAIRRGTARRGEGVSPGVGWAVGSATRDDAPGWPAGRGRVAPTGWEGGRASAGFARRGRPPPAPAPSRRAGAREWRVRCDVAPRRGRTARGPCPLRAARRFDLRRSRRRGNSRARRWRGRALRGRARLDSRPDPRDRPAVPPP